MPHSLFKYIILTISLSCFLLSLGFSASLNTGIKKIETLFQQPKVQTIYLGIDVLALQKFAPLKGKRVGLLTHPAGLNREGRATIDILYNEPTVQLVVLFGPEHGIDGKEKAEQPIEDRTHPRTGLPVYSLYGKYRKPLPNMLKNIDVMIIDLQDIGVRSYTYISCMRYTMEACFEEGVEVMVLDRPNPLGGLKVDGPPLDKECFSYVGAYPIPYVHGLTIGEIAQMAKDKAGWLQVNDTIRKNGKLTVIKMQGWTRNQLWSDTGLRWVATSPAIPDLAAVMGYSMTGLGCQLGGFKHGYGSIYPFRVLTYPGKSEQDIITKLKQRHIAGLDYKLVVFKDGAGKEQKGVYIIVKDFQKWHPTELSFHLMSLSCEFSQQNIFKEIPAPKAELFNKHVGSMAWWNELKERGQNARVKTFVNQWQQQATSFQKMSSGYWLYKTK